MQDLQTLLNLVQQSRETYAAVFLAVSRYLVPALGAWLLLHCARPLISFRREPEIWAWLKFTDGTQVAVTHWENVIGRAKSSDITVALSTVSRNHAVLTRYDDGSWTITDASSKTGTWVNGERVDIRAIGEGDVISIGGVDFSEMKLELPRLFAEKYDDAGNLIKNTLYYGNFISAVINFLILALVVFFLVKGDAHGLPAERAGGGIWSLFSGLRRRGGVPVGAVLFLSGHSPPLL